MMQTSSRTCRQQITRKKHSANYCKHVPVKNKGSPLDRKIMQTATRLCLSTHGTGENSHSDIDCDSSQKLQDQFSAHKPYSKELHSNRHAPASDMTFPGIGIWTALPVLPQLTPPKTFPKSNPPPPPLLPTPS